MKELDLNQIIQIIKKTKNNTITPEEELSILIKEIEDTEIFLREQSYHIELLFGEIYIVDPANKIRMTELAEEIQKKYNRIQTLTKEMES